MTQQTGRPTIDDTAIVRNKAGSIVGRIDSRVFYKEVHGNRHMLRKPLAWAIDVDVFDRVVVPLCSQIQITDKDTGYRYICGVNTFKDKHQTLNRKFGDQYYLELVHWRVQG